MDDLCITPRAKSLVFLVRNEFVLLGRSPESGNTIMGLEEECRDGEDFRECAFRQTAEKLGILPNTHRLTLAGMRYSRLEDRDHVFEETWIFLLDDWIETPKPNPVFNSFEWHPLALLPRESMPTEYGEWLPSLTSPEGRLIIATYGDLDRILLRELSICRLPESIRRTPITSA